MKIFQFIFSAATISLASAETIAEINGDRFLSPLRDQIVTDVKGLVTAKGPDGFWIRSTTPDNDLKTSESVHVSAKNIAVTVGDIIQLNGKVTEFRARPTFLFLTEITSPTNIRVISSNNKVKAVVLGGKDTSPPTDQYTALDKGDVFGLPNNESQLSTVNPVLEPSNYGLDFWKSLVGELVTIKSPVAIGKPNDFGDTWVRGNWKVTGKNKRGGLTLFPGDGNPEALLVGSPLDTSKNSKSTKLGDSLEDITGVITQVSGSYAILPTTALKIIKSAIPALPEPVTWSSKGECSSLTVGSYNVENMSPTSTNIPAVANHIVKYLNSPDIMFIQEIQDNDGPINDGIVNANKTLDVLTAAIKTAGGPSYSYVNIDPIDDTTGGQPGGNIRPAYLYNSKFLSLNNANPGNAKSATKVLSGPALSLNPGLIDPSNSVWTSSRRPLVAQWKVKSSGSTFFTVNVHFGSKGGSSSIGGDARPPVNAGVDKRLAQANVTAEFIGDILAENPSAAIIAAGDFNEFQFVAPLDSFMDNSGLMDLNIASDLAREERYTYLFEASSQELDHMFISPRIATGRVNIEHVHVNTWVERSKQASDHDPSVARLDVC